MISFPFHFQKKTGIRIFALLLSVLLCLALIWSVPVYARADKPSEPVNISVADLVENLTDAVVNISTAQSLPGRSFPSLPGFPEGSPFQDFFEQFFDQRNFGEKLPSRRVQSLGSGFVIDGEEGLIVTNNHVIERADEIKVNFNDGMQLPAQVIGRDEKTDIALLKVDTDKELTSLSFGDSDALRVGDWVMAIGNPFGLGGSVTIGIVSARNRDINAGPYDNFIQTDAAINRGNSGGPLFNMEGKVVGINTVIISPSGGSIGIGFAVPSKTAMLVLAQLREFGETRRGWLGVRIQKVTESIAEGLGIESVSGALVSEVTPGGPAEVIGIHTGDVIVSFDGKPIREMRELPRLVAVTPIGKTVEVGIIRDGKPLSFTVKIGRLEEEPVLSSSDYDRPFDEGYVRDFGLTVSALTDSLREEYGIEEGHEGVLITAIDPSSPAQEKGVYPGHIISSVSQKPVRTPEELRSVITLLKKQGRKMAILLLDSPEGDTHFVALPLLSESQEGE